jgi:hypothetical protein
MSSIHVLLCLLDAEGLLELVLVTGEVVVKPAILASAFIFLMGFFNVTYQCHSFAAKPVQVFSAVLLLACFVLSTSSACQSRCTTPHLAQVT